MKLVKDLIIHQSSSLKVLASVSGVAILLNAIEIYRINKAKCSHDRLIFSLAIADILSAISILIPCIILMTMHDYVSMIAILPYFIKLGELFALSSSILHITAIAIDRFHAVGFPLNHRTKVKRKLSRRITIILWIASILSTAANIFLFPEYASKIYLSVMTIIASGVSLFCYYLITVVTLQTPKGAKTAVSIIRKKRERVLVGNSVAVSLAFLACSCPMLITMLSAPTLYATALLLILLNCVINPVIYFCRVCINSYLGENTNNSQIFL